MISLLSINLINNLLFLKF